MASFSQRKGLKPVHKLVQIDAIDEPLRNRLWNGLYYHVMVHALDADLPYGSYTADARSGSGIRAESVCRLIGGGKTLGDAPKGIRDKIDLHPALEKGFGALYGYTSDKGGIRHALLEESSVDSTDARFMLVTCSAFVNFVVAKASTAGIELKETQ